MNSNLNNLRKQIDQCDTELIQLLAKRFTITNQVGLLKQQNNIDSIDPARETKLSKHIAQLAKKNGIDPKLSQKVFRNIIDQVVVDHEAIKRKASINSTSSKPSVGIIGMGDFGKLAEQQLKKFCELRCFDVNIKRTGSQLADVMQSDFVVLAVPLSAIEGLLKQIKSILKPSTILIDVCSVKQKPIELFNKVLPQHNNVVFTHPLFGPQSAASSLAGHTIIFCNPNTTTAKKVRSFCQGMLGLKTVAMSAEQHDRIMADMHALTFFVARALNNFGLRPSKFQTPSFQKLLDLVELDKSHSQDLFETVECGNSLANDVRQQFIQELQKVDNNLC